MKTHVSLLRKTSLGIKGSVRNAKHHAEAILPFIAAMRNALPLIGFAEWSQGNNVHEFRTQDGRRFTLRAFTKDGAYLGVRLALRASRSSEHRLMDITDVSEVPAMLNMMSLLAQSAKGDATALLAEKPTQH